MGVQTVKISDIETGGKNKNIIDFLKIVQGKQKGPKNDLVAINAAASLYTMREANSISESVPKAQEIIKSGEGFKVLERLVKARGKPKTIKTMDLKNLLD